ncbi:C-type lectin domain family 2 member D, partial [Varanus komodoensis]
MTPVLRQLHWLPIEIRAQFKVLVMTYKALNSLGPGYLKERLRPYKPAHPLRSVGEALLREPSVKEIRRDFLLQHKGASDYWFGLRRIDEQPWKWTNGSDFNNWFPIGANGPCAYLNDEAASSTWTQGSLHHSPRPSYPHNNNPVSQRVPGSLVSHPLGLTVLLLNARSVNNKSALIHDLIVDEGADLACITETWAGGGDVALSQVCPPGYLVQHCSRLEGRGGGVALVYRASIYLTGLSVPSGPGLECLYLVLGDRDRLGILLVYRAPFCPTVSLPELTETVSDLVLRTPRMLVLRDFNLHAEASLTGAAQDFMTSMTAMGLSQRVTGPTHERGHTLDLVFTTGQEEGGLRVRNLCLTPLSWSDHFLVRFVLESDFSLCKGVDPIVWVHPRSRMDPEGFLKALGEFPADKTGAPVEALVELWNGEMTRAVDMIAPKRPLPPGRTRSSPWYTPELRAMKQVGRRLERRWRKSRDESDQTHLRAHYRAYAVAARCDDFARHFREKIAQICHELDTTIDSELSKETPTLPSGPDLLDEFQLLRPNDVDKVLGRVRPTTCLLDPCPSWLINDSKHGIGTWILEVVNASLREGRVPAPLKEAVVRPVLKKASLDPEMATNYRPVANIPFLGKVLERVVAGQLQALSDETDYLDPLQSSFRPGYSTESALVALYDDLCREKDRGSASLLVLLDLSAAFDTIDHGIPLDRLAGLGVGGTALQWFRSYLNGRFQKEAVVRPVLKKASLDPEMATNYRPVANIPFLGKVLEWVVAGQLQALLDETDYLDPLQSGFRPGYGTESALVALYDDLCKEQDRGSASLLVLLDLSAAFDTIDHGIPLDRLAGLGVGGTALQWFRSYLNGRSQK